MNNPPAFPRAGVVDGSQMLVAHNDGMTLRDYFAAAAVTGMLSESGCEVVAKVAASEHTTELQMMARYAFKLADAMLKARGQ